MPNETPLRILHLEDDPDYRLFVQDLLTSEGCAVSIKDVADRAGFENAVRNEAFDVILGDFSLPDYSGLHALAFTRENAPRTPFLLVSGTIGEHAAIESLRAGATDYVLKQWPERLLPAIRRAVEESRERIRREHAEAELARKENYFRALTHNAQDIVCLLDSAGQFLYTNPAVQATLGRSPEDLRGDSFFALLHPEDQERARHAFAFGLTNPDQTLVLEVRIGHQQGQWSPFEAVGQNHLADPHIAAFVFNLRDTTERKRLERRHQALYHLGRRLSSVSAVREAAELIREAADDLFAPDVFTLDLLTDDLDFMRPVLNLDIINGVRTVVETPGGVHPTSRFARQMIERGGGLIRKPAGQALEGARPFGDTNRPSAALLFVPVRNRHKVIGLLSVQSYTPDAFSNQDLESLQILADHCGGALERIAAEQAGRENERRFQEIFANSPDAIFVEDLLGQVLDVNPAGCRLHGLTRAELIGRNVVELVPEEYRREVARDFQKFVDGSLTRVEGESAASDGRVTPVEIRATRIEYGGHPALLLHVRDISERKRAESALRSSETLFHSVWENSVDGMRLTDEHGHIVAVNEAYCKLVGRSRAELEGNPFTVIYAGSEQPERLLQKYEKHFRDRIIDRQTQSTLTLHDGSMVILEDTSSFVELRGQPPLLLGLFRDVSAQKKLEDQLRQSQKMEAIGQLAGGVAHDFNNILTVIHGHASLLLGAGELMGRAARSAQQIVQASERAAGLTRQLLTFSRRQVMQPRRLDLNEVVANMNKMLSRILGEDIALQLGYWPEPVAVKADAGMMEQVLLNLAVNARDAMPRGGQLKLHITREIISAEHARKHAEAQPGRFACLSVTDSGTGIAPEILRRIFEPFFTTKEVGKGTGLGLATVYGIVKQHRGWVEVESLLGAGATFRVYLPELAEAELDRGDDSHTDIFVRGGKETILLVEDEQPVRELLSSLLQSHGYHILEAETGIRALEVWRHHKQEIALLLTDIVMPDRMNGRQLAETLWAERPGLKVILTSGYSADVVGKDWVLRPGFNYVQKPYSPHKLAQTVRACLDAEAATPAL